MQLPGSYTRQGLPVSMIILAIAVAVFFLQPLAYADIMRLFALWPLATPDQIRFADAGVLDTGFGPWQLITYGFLHGGLAHLFFNMFALYMFGLPLERLWGTRRFVTFYFVCLVGAGVVQLIVADITGGIYPTIGASGAIFGLLLAYGMTWPNSTLMLLFPPIPMKAKYFVIGYGALTLFLGLTGTAPGIAHFAHLGGMLFGFLMLLYWHRQARGR